MSSWRLFRFCSSSMLVSRGFSRCLLTGDPSPFSFMLLFIVHWFIWIWPFISYWSLNIVVQQELLWRVLKFLCLSGRCYYAMLLSLLGSIPFADQSFLSFSFSNFGPYRWLKGWAECEASEHWAQLTEQGNFTQPQMITTHSASKIINHIHRL